MLDSSTWRRQSSIRPGPRHKWYFLRFQRIQTCLRSSSLFSVCACASASPTLIAPGTCQSSGPPGGGSSGGSGPSNSGGNGGSGSPTTTPGGGGGASPTCNTEAPDCGAVATSAVPSCAQACFTSAAPKISCGVDDYACQCQPAAQASLSQILVPCVATACPAASLEAVITGASSVCACATGSSGSSNCGGSGGPGGSGGSGSPTGGNGGGEGGSGGSEPTGGSGGSGGSGGEGGSGGNGGGNGGGSQPTSPPTIPPSAGSRLEMSLVAGVFALTWAIAVVL
ncbi:uncharacterized protein Triagg1_1388 [Trichoderma aggressivum f. europaeum]|uniref:CFEM domain-containing protein n=1 Tax=Trichoderma aggressivum f. europaeum TaxID=173218 RepID=A0AAE1IIP8_9HYPO|nr:hypothetical protein Triagg1_1388 [Trichoderma aggressivum f. europaeum]